MTGRRVSMTAAHFLILGVMYALNPDLSLAQVPSRIRVVVPAAPVLDASGSRGITIVTALEGSVFEVLGKDGDWYWIILPPDSNGTSRPGYIGAENIEIVMRPDGQGERAAPATAVFAAEVPRPLVPQTSQSEAAPDGRGGFTMLLDLGVGVQGDDVVEEWAGGLAGLNVGVGAFLTKDLALMFRFSSTTVSYESYSLLSGVAGPMVQYWVSDRFNVRAGGGVGFVSDDYVTDTAFGLILGAGVTVFQRGKHNLQIGVEYAPVFTSGRIHNFGFTFGYQLL